MASVWEELKRRNVVRVAVAYAIATWLTLQLTEVLMSLLSLPEWVGKLVLLLLVVGFPLTLFLAWAFELTPEGIKKEKDVDRSESVTHVTGRKLDFVIIGVLAIAVLYFVVEKFIWPSEMAPESSADASVAAPQATEKSIAVLPFVNMSEESGNEYFADGLSEELLNMLVKIPELRVAARTSSFSFKGKDLKISEIAHELNVSHVLEGSVRKSGNKVRITAQLIKADDGFHLWSETFDRTLDDIFVVQDEIASEVAQALEMTLMGKSQADRMIDPEAYALYLKGLYFTLQRDAENYKKSEEALLQAIELDPGYAEAWAALAMNYFDQTRFKLKTREDGAALARKAIGRAKSLGPDLGIVWGVDSYLKKSLDWDWGAAQAAINKAYELEPKNKTVSIWRGAMASSLGKLDDAVELYEQGLLDDPLNLSHHSALGITYTKVHRYDKAIEIFEKQVELKPDYYWAYFNLGKSYLFRGDAEQALLEIRKNPENVFRHAGLVMAYSTLGREAEAEEALKRLVSDYGTQNPFWIAEAYGWRGQKDEAFEWLEKAFMQRSIGLSYVLGNNVLYSLTDDSRWTELLKKINLLEYWQAMPPEYGGPTKPPG